MITTTYIHINVVQRENGRVGHVLIFAEKKEFWFHGAKVLSRSGGGKRRQNDYANYIRKNENM